MGQKLTNFWLVVGLPPFHKRENLATILEIFLYAFTNMYDFFITHGRGFCYAVPSRNLLDQNLFLKVVCFYVIVFDQAKANIMNLLR